jgi:hypothetical protein
VKQVRLQVVGLDNSGFTRRYERSATLVTSNLPFNEWTEASGSERLTGALLDRLTHHVHILEMNGESYRLKDSKQRRPSKARSYYSHPVRHLPAIWGGGFRSGLSAPRKRVAGLRSSRPRKSFT